MTNSINMWMSSSVLLLASCAQPSTELGSTRTQWHWTSSSLELVSAIAVTPDDEVVALVLDDASRSQTLRLFDAEGGILWDRARESAADVAVDADGTIVVVTADEGEGALLSYDTSGELRGQTPLPSGIEGPRLAVLADGHIVVSANIEGEATLSSYDPSGELRWTSSLSDAGLGSDLWVQSVAASPIGHVAVGGSLPEGGAWVARSSVSGHIQWAQELQGHEWLSGVAVGGDGTVFAVGNGAAGSDHWRVDLDADGTVAWQQVDERRSPHIIDAAIGRDGARYWVGSDEANGVAVLFAVEPDGAPRWHETVSGPPPTTGDVDEDGAVDIAFMASGDIVTGGILDYRGRGGEDWGFRGWLTRYASGE